MIIIEVLANRIADQMAGQLNLDHNRRSVIAYGLIGLLQVTALFMIITAIGVVTDTLYESWVILFSVGYIRKSTGGAHSKTLNGCNTLSILSITIMALLSRYILNIAIESYLNYGVTMAIFFISYLVFYLRVPVDSPNKPIEKPDKIRRLRKQSFIKLSLFLLLTVGAIYFAESNNRLYSISSSIRIAMIWQTMTLTEFGIELLADLDSIISRILGRLKIL